MKFEDLTPQDLLDRSDEVGECWIWNQATSDAGYPIMKVRGCGCRLVRRLAAELAGHELKPRQPVVTTCDEKKCVRPEHCLPSSNQAVAQKAADAGAFSQPQRGAKIAAGRRAKSAKLTMEQAMEIRNSTEVGHVLAARYGIDKSRVNAIKRGEAWKDYANPFTGLFAGLAANDSTRRRA